ncbi:hypothetical protein GQ53DRAFT_426613 [Thozetella sp. PMI_491]|nr:hypothetical protein GQ53DRAFT_426613 [Thozetella sp. PMI_491]
MDAALHFDLCTQPAFVQYLAMVQGYNRYIGARRPFFPFPCFSHLVYPALPYHSSLHVSSGPSLCNAWILRNSRSSTVLVPIRDLSGQGIYPGGTLLESLHVDLPPPPLSYSSSSSPPSHTRVSFSLSLLSCEANWCPNGLGFSLTSVPLCISTPEALVSHRVSLPVVCSCGLFFPLTPLPSLPPPSPPPPSTRDLDHKSLVPPPAAFFATDSQGSINTIGCCGPLEARARRSLLQKRTTRPPSSASPPPPVFQDHLPLVLSKKLSLVACVLPSDNPNIIHHSLPGLSEHGQPVPFTNNTHPLRRPSPCTAPAART